MGAGTSPKAAKASPLPPVKVPVMLQTSFFTHRAAERYVGEVSILPFVGLPDTFTFCDTIWLGFPVLRRTISNSWVWVGTVNVTGPLAGCGAAPGTSTVQSLGE